MEKFIRPHEGVIQKDDRQRLNGHTSAIVWFTGLPGSGEVNVGLPIGREAVQEGDTEPL